MNMTFLKSLKTMKRLRYFMVFLLAFTLAGCGAAQESAAEKTDNEPAYEAVDETTEEVVDKNSQETIEETEENEAGLSSDDPDNISEDEEELPEDGIYTSKDDVAGYIYLYGHLPSNFITKKDAQALGWEGGSLEPYAPGKCIGGNRFGNYEGILPEKEGRSYTECDIDTLGADKRGAKRIVFSNDGLIYYTEDHYESFELLYGEE